MGCSGSLPQDAQSSTKKVVIVGGSFAGFHIAEQLWDTFEVTIIDKKDYIDFSPAATRMLVNVDAINEFSATFEESLRGFPGKFKYIQGELLTVNKNNSIKIKTKLGSNQTVAYDYLVLATGYIYPEPIRDNNVLTLEGRKKKLAEYHSQIDNAKSILVVGSGPVGIEAIGEIIYTYGKTKKLGICTRGNRLLKNYPPKTSECAEDYLKKHNVSVHYNVNYNQEWSLQNGYDYTVTSLGQLYKADFLKDNFAKAVAPNGQIYVNNLLQIIDVDPATNAMANPVKQNIFAFGDCNLTSLKEEKNIPSMRNYSPALVQNIKDLAAGLKPSTQIPKSIPLVAYISLGPEYGIIAMGDQIDANEGVGPIKVGVLKQSIAAFKAPAPKL